MSLGWSYHLYLFFSGTAVLCIPGLTAFLTLIFFPAHNLAFFLLLVDELTLVVIVLTILKKLISEQWPLVMSFLNCSLLMFCFWAMSCDLPMTLKRIVKI